MSGETEALHRLIEEWAAANPRVRRREFAASIGRPVRLDWLGPDRC